MKYNLNIQKKSFKSSFVSIKVYLNLIIIVIYVKKRLLDVLILKSKNKRNNQLTIKLLITRNNSKKHNNRLTQSIIADWVLIIKNYKDDRMTSK
jgi:hypothetical protein